MSIKLHRGIESIEDWWIYWFGIYGRELGSNNKHRFGVHPKGYNESHRKFTNDYKTFLKFVSWCKENKSACWITSQPMRRYGMPFGIEKVFFDFDYPLEKEEKMTKEKHDKVKKQVLEFVNKLDVEPLIISTRKGFHVYVFLRRIYEFEEKHLDFATELFGVLGLSLLGMPKLYCQLTDEDRKKWKYLDFGPLGDIMRMARVPLTWHEKTGERCLILNRKLRPTKVRSLDLYRGYGLGEDKVRDAIEIVKAFHKKQIKRREQRIKNGASQFKDDGKFEGEMRPCFTKRLETGEMSHAQRRAFLMEAYWSGFNTFDKLMKLCENFNDFIWKKSATQVRWYLKNKTHFPPYRCSTIERHGWCLKDECVIYRKRHKK